MYNDRVVKEAEITLGKSRRVEMNIPNHTVKVGQWILLYSEIPAVKISDTDFLVYLDATIDQVRSWEEEMNERLKMMNKQLSLLDKLAPEPEYEAVPKYVKTKHGSRRVRPWESPRYFG